mmetsp:Transcript_81949/g.244398  ORF Transcript_81949/g.244398 Transcript_81949/m.244398 type:complete len:228 (-) Transcript_81949:331-1014(-)
MAPVALPGHCHYLRRAAPLLPQQWQSSVPLPTLGRQAAVQRGQAARRTRPRRSPHWSSWKRVARRRPGLPHHPHRLADRPSRWGLAPAQAQRSTPRPRPAMTRQPLPSHASTATKNGAQRLGLDSARGRGPRASSVSSWRVSFETTESRRSWMLVAAIGPLAISASWTGRVYTTQAWTSCPMWSVRIRPTSRTRRPCRREASRARSARWAASATHCRVPTCCWSRTS